MWRHAQAWSSQFSYKSLSLLTCHLQNMLFPETLYGNLPFDKVCLQCFQKKRRNTRRWIQSGGVLEWQSAATHVQKSEQSNDPLRKNCKIIIFSLSFAGVTDLLDLPVALGLTGISSTTGNVYLLVLRKIRILELSLHNQGAKHTLSKIQGKRRQGMPNITKE